MIQIIIQHLQVNMTFAPKRGIEELKLPNDKQSLPFFTKRKTTKSKRGKIISFFYFHLIKRNAYGTKYEINNMKSRTSYKNNKNKR